MFTNNLFYAALHTIPLIFAHAIRNNTVLLQTATNDGKSYAVREGALIVR